MPCHATLHHAAQGHPKDVTALAYHPDASGNTLVTGCDDRALRVWDLRTNR